MHVLSALSEHAKMLLGLSVCCPLVEIFLTGVTSLLRHHKIFTLMYRSLIIIPSFCLAWTNEYAYKVQ